MKKLLKVMKKIGVRFHCTGGNYWLGFLPVIAAVLTKQSAIALYITGAAFGLWALLTISRLIPETWLDLEKQEPPMLKELRTLLEAREKRLLNQFCYNITSRLQLIGLPEEDAAWDFVTPDPLNVLLNGEQVRIKLLKSSLYCAADVIMDNGGCLKVNLVCKSDSTQQAAEIVKNIETMRPSQEDAETLQDWIDAHFSEIEEMAFKKQEKGQYSFDLEKAILPDKKYWPALCENLQSQGYIATALSDTRICIAIEKEKAA